MIKSGKMAFVAWEPSTHEYAVWNKALSDEEITAIASGISPLLIAQDNLVYYTPGN